MSFLEIFPPLVLEMVFSHLTITEIVKSTLISPGARNVISNSVRLMQNIRFKITGRRMRQPTRKYSKIDFFNLNRRSTFKDLPVCLSQLTFEGCKMEADVFHALLSKITKTLELLIVNSCLFYDNGCYSKENFDVKTETKLQPQNFPKLTNLILVDMEGRPQLILLSIIRATNLIELGMVKICCSSSRLEKNVGKLYVDLINANSKLKILDVPSLAAQMFLAHASEHREVEYCLEELSLGFEPNLDFFDSTVMDFLESQKNSLKRLRIEGCVIGGEYSERLLTMHLVRLEIHRCAVYLMPNSATINTSIESLSCTGYDDLSHQAVRSFVERCKNLLACVALLDTEPAKLFVSNSWRFIDVDEMIPERIPWADLRSLRFAGAAIAISFMKNYRGKKRYHIYNDELKEVTVENHPYSIIKFIKKGKN